MKIKGLKIFNLFSFFSSLDFYIPIKVIYFYQITGSYSTASAIISIAWVSQALLELPTGIFSDLVGRKKTIVAGAFCSFLGYLLYAAGTNYWIFFLGSIVEGAARSFYSGNNNAYLHNLLSEGKIEEKYHHHYGKLNSFMSLAMFLSALTSGALVQVSIKSFMWINTIPQLISFVISLFLQETSKKGNEETNIYKHLKEAILELRRNINLRYLSLSQMLSGSGFAAYEYQAAVFALVWPTWAIGIARGLQEGGVIPSFYYAGRIIDKLGEVKIIAISWITSVLGNILVVLSQSFLSPLFIIVSLPLYGAYDTANQKLLQKEFTEKQRATIASLNSLGNSITFSISLYIVGLIANQHGPFIALLATQIFLIPSAFFQFKFLRRIKND